MKASVLPVLIALASAAWSLACEPGGVLVEPAACRVESVTDGDTIRVSCLDAGVRLLLVDAPEVARGGNAAECFGDESRAYLRERLPVGAVVTLERGVLDRDQFDRYLRYVFVAGELINESLVREGFAVRYRAAEDTTYRARIAAAEASAAAAGRGLWSAC